MLEYIISAWGFLIICIFAASAINKIVEYYIFSIIGYVGAFLIIASAFRKANKIKKKHNEGLIDSYYNNNSYTAHYIKCPSCGEGCPPGTTFCDKCGNDITKSNKF